MDRVRKARYLGRVEGRAGHYVAHDVIGSVPCDGEPGTVEVTTALGKNVGRVWIDAAHARTLAGLLLQAADIADGRPDPRAAVPVSETDRGRP